MKKNMKIGLVLFGLFFLIVIIIFSIGEPKFIFILNGEELEEVMSCENLWHYENIDFLPCLYNRTRFGGLPKSVLNFTIPPQENCIKYNSEFVGFNVYNQTANEEILREISPNCTIIKAEEISEGDLKANCVCTYYGFSLCKEYDCGGIIVRRN